MAAPQLRSLGDLDQLLSESQQRPVLVFKHSTTCPISARAHAEWEEFLGSAEAAQVGTALVRVIEDRPVSLALADRVGVQHKSPQALLVHQGKALWSESHYAITADALKKALTLR